VKIRKTVVIHYASGLREAHYDITEIYVHENGAIDLFDLHSQTPFGPKLEATEQVTKIRIYPAKP
jgi:hypothetical protein